MPSRETLTEAADADDAGAMQTAATIAANAACRDLEGTPLRDCIFMLVAPNLRQMVCAGPDVRGTVAPDRRLLGPVLAIYRLPNITATT
jgi:hypothetical protein